MPEHHVVREKDGMGSLWSIAEHYGVSWSELLELNKGMKERIPPYGINPGDVVLIPDRRWSKHKVRICKSNCPAHYILALWLRPAIGKAENGILMQSLALPPGQFETTIEYYLDFSDEDNRLNQVPVSGSGVFRSATGQPIVRVITQETYDKLKRLYIWAPGMLASFRESGRDRTSAFCRIDIPRWKMAFADAAMHPSTQEPLPPGSKTVNLYVDVLQHPAQYILAEMIRNAHGDEIPTGETHDGSGFIKLGTRWALKAATTRDWDYKKFDRLAGIWGENIRLGNYSRGVLNDSMSNLHYGYLGAVGGLTLAETLEISRIGGWLFERPDGPDDIYAMTVGHGIFSSAHGKAVWVKEREALTQIVTDMRGEGMSELVTIPVEGGAEKDVDLSKYHPRPLMVRRAPNSSWLVPTYEGYQYYYMKQPIREHPTFAAVRDFLLAYNLKFPGPPPKTKWDEVK